jgi:protein-disulfide isomerase
MKYLTAALTLGLMLAPLLLTPVGCAQGPKPAVSGKRSALDKTALEAYLRHIELFRGPVTFRSEDPKPSKSLPGFSEVVVHWSFEGGGRDDLYYVSADGQNVIKGDIYNINQNPFQGNLDKLTTNDLPSFGPANAPVTIVEFGDLQCPDCKMEAPVLRQMLPAAFGDKVRVYFKDFPLESIHPWARAAAIAARCVYHEDAKSFWGLYDWVYDNQEQITGDNLKSKVLGWAGGNHVDTAKLGRCIDTKATEPEVNRSIAEGRSLGVRGTPTLFINGRKIGGLQWPDLQMVINLELQYMGVK